MTTDAASPLRTDPDPGVEPGPPGAAELCRAVAQRFTALVDGGALRRAPHGFGAFPQNLALPTDAAAPHDRAAPGYVSPCTGNPWGRRSGSRLRTQTGR
ncbi:hypothetical protein ACF05W_14925 [Streptomyces lydicus]|uniref:hypothetical protein n=1 Tax=Streptomyces lydicus TaxID=47763 RepID=UPI0036FED423